MSLPALPNNLCHRSNSSLSKEPVAYECFYEEKDEYFLGDQRFYSSPQACIQSYENRSFCERFFNTLKSYNNFFSYIYEDYKTDNLLIAHKILPLTDLSNRKLTKNKLVVLFPGLNSSPYTFKELINQSEKKDLSEFDIYIPKVLNQGNAALDEAARPIFLKIKEWAAKIGDKELFLVGESNGARIARAVDAELSRPENIGNVKKIKFVSIAGACQGSKMVNIANSLHLNCMLNESISIEMATDSERTLRLNDEWLEGIRMTPGVDRQYNFIAASDDWLVPNYDSSLYEVPSGLGRYTIIPGHGHLSIVDESATIVSQLIFP